MSKPRTDADLKAFFGTWDEEDLVDLIADKMSDVNDMDVTFRDFAKAIVKALDEAGVLKDGRA